MNTTTQNKTQSQVTSVFDRDETETGISASERIAIDVLGDVQRLRETDYDGIQSLANKIFKCQDQDQFDALGTELVKQLDGAMEHAKNAMKAAQMLCATRQRELEGRA